MKAYLQRRIPVVVAVGLALAMLALGFLAALGVRSLVAGTASASPDPPNPGHEWSQVEGHGIDGSTYWLGTTADQALELRVNGERALRLEPNASSPNVISGYSGNSVTDGVWGASIGGGGASGTTNRVTDLAGTVAGGTNNQAGDNGGTTSDASGAAVGGGNTNTASGEASFVGGGYSNTASGATASVAGGNTNTASGMNAAVAGGFTNTASGIQSTVGGGLSNDASGYLATIGGGNHNTASGWSSTVPGGQDNTAQGEFSFAAGRRAKADDIGAFVWADNYDLDFTSTAVNEFSARTTGGARFVTAIDGAGAPTAGVTLAPGGGSWSSISDLNAKANFSSVDGQDVLASLAEVPITTWNYKAQDSSIRHMGPMAQDFYAAFSLGESETAITTVDADGVALAAVQGLYQLSQEQASRIAALEEENATLQQRLDDLESRVSALEAGTGVSAAVSQASASGLPTPWLLLGGGLTLALGGLVLVQRRLVGGRR
jgi:hypothetical protein